MVKYALLKRFHKYFQLQVYMYAFMYVYPDIKPVEEFFQIQKYLLKLQEYVNSRTSPKILDWIHFHTLRRL